jgi:hypothetical protein
LVLGFAAFFFLSSFLSSFAFLFFGGSAGLAGGVFIDSALDVRDDLDALVLFVSTSASSAALPCAASMLFAPGRTTFPVNSADSAAVTGTGSWCRASNLTTAAEAAEAAVDWAEE